MSSYYPLYLYYHLQVSLVDVPIWKNALDAWNSMIARKMRRRLVAYADAGLSDNSAIGHAVASGLNETWQRGEAGESWWKQNGNVRNKHMLG